MVVRCIIKKGLKDSNYIPFEGEAVYAVDTKDFLVGDGATSVRNLETMFKLNNIVKSQNGDLYYINIDNNGSIRKTIPIKLKNDDKDVEYHISVSDDKKNIGHEYYSKLSKDQQKMIDNIMLSTMDMCSELTDENLIFTESAAYKGFKYEMLGHMLENEFYNPYTKKWENLNEK